MQDKLQQGFYFVQIIQVLHNLLVCMFDLLTPDGIVKV